MSTADADAAFASYPPHYTRQPRAETWRAQRARWAAHVARVVAARPSPAIDVATDDVFVNAAIDRALPLAARVEIVDELVARGDARWTPGTPRTRALVYDRASRARAVDALGAFVARYDLRGRVYTTREIARELGLDETRAREVASAFADAGACVAFGDDGVKFA
ncbi:ESCRT-II complex, vps25 subunit [Ostreococcus tauri]|uniref:ESCRT-II complex, vps25 subunit n=1 Tax=Ostreococcus tauri TaxID=70448 RepID=A0A096PAP7_OSTTA|nr:ESCRT-II complex, vps25 subunit [Ostreococcus tauri]CEG01975.1 ESCRT-II complex, vps25 subunit [Ostreococcus tauri]|eukprot:XP_022841282.1 ESCRT-II complex, vps25 subunit [Ostreococcus tauri]